MFNELRTADELVGATKLDLLQAINAHFSAALAIERSARRNGWTEELRAAERQHNDEAYRLQDLSSGKPLKPRGGGCRSAAATLLAVRRRLNSFN